MAIVSNWLISIFCIYVLYKENWVNTTPSKLFKIFYIILGISTFFSGFGHSLFKYFDVYGKFPAWILAASSGYFISKGILFYWKEKKSYLFWNYFLLIKTIGLISASLINKNFLFIAIDSIFTYIIFCGFIAGKLWREGMEEMKYFVFGIFVLFPSAFIFLFKINLHLYLNRDDLSHLLILFTVMFFYKGIKINNLRSSKKSLVA